MYFFFQTNSKLVQLHHPLKAVKIMFGKLQTHIYATVLFENFVKNIVQLSLQLSYWQWHALQKAIILKVTFRIDRKDYTRLDYPLYITFIVSMFRRFQFFVFAMVMGSWILSVNGEQLPNTQKFCYSNENKIFCWVDSMTVAYARPQNISKTELLATIF